MDNLLKNKKTIILCVLLIAITLLFYMFYKDNNSLIDYNNENYEYLKKYSSNEIIPVYVTDEDIANKYLNDYKNNMLFNVSEAYESLNKEYREKRFTNIEGYKNYLDTIISISTYSIEVDKYNISNIKGNKIFNIYDKSGNQYIFKEISIMNYEVYLDEYTVKID